DPTRAGVIFSLESVFGSYFGWLLGGETFTQLALFGAILMVMGMIISELKPVIRYLIDKITG
ncbi:MAG: EamA family transporter, partial [Deltaproteobacteria bacterium CG_4_10_14_0_2_um_filter_43_8]